MTDHTCTEKIGSDSVLCLWSSKVVAKNRYDINTKIGLRLDVSTKWNSTYTVLESAIRYRRAFSSLQLIDRNYKFASTNEEWSKG